MVHGSKKRAPRTEEQKAARRVQLLEETLTFRKRVLPADHPDIATSMNNLAIAYRDLGRHEDALQLLEEKLAVRKRMLPADHPDIATSMGNLASTYRDEILVPLDMDNLDEILAAVVVAVPTRTRHHPCEPSTVTASIVSSRLKRRKVLKKRGRLL